MLVFHREPARSQEQIADRRGRNATRCYTADASAISLRHRCFCGVARSSAFDMDVAVGRRRLLAAVATDQVIFCKVLAYRRATKPSPTSSRRARHLAASILGASD